MRRGVEANRKALTVPEPAAGCSAISAPTFTVLVP